MSTTNSCIICQEEFPVNSGVLCTECGMRACYGCFKGMVDSGRTMRCPQCRSTEPLVKVGAKARITKLKERMNAIRKELGDIEKELSYLEPTPAPAPRPKRRGRSPPVPPPPQDLSTSESEPDYSSTTTEDEEDYSQTRNWGTPTRVTGEFTERQSDAIRRYRVRHAVRVCSVARCTSRTRYLYTEEVERNATYDVYEWCGNHSHLIRTQAILTGEGLFNA